MSIKKISAIVMIGAGLFLIVTSVLWSKDYPTSEIVKNTIIGLGFFVGGIGVYNAKK